MNIIDRFCGKLGLMDIEEDDSKVLDLDKPAESNPEDFKAKKPDNLLSLHGASTGAAGKPPLKVMVVEPLAFDDAQYIADHLKAHKPVVINLENTEDDVNQRVIDFISGVAYALNGNIQKVGGAIFLCTPPNVEVTYNVTCEDKATMSWLNK